MNTVDAQIRIMLAVELKVEDQELTDGFRWLDVMGSEDAECFLEEVNDVFTPLPLGFSFGEGKQPFGNITADMLEQIATVRGLVAHIERHVTNVQS